MPVQLAFQDEKVRQTCESPVSAKRRLGESAASSLRARLADLRAADSPIQLVELGFATLSQDKETHIVIQVGSGYVLVAAVNNRPEPRLSSGKLDWKQVSRLKILSIERVHEN